MRLDEEELRVMREARALQARMIERHVPEVLRPFLEVYPGGLPEEGGPDDVIEERLQLARSGDVQGLEAHLEGWSMEDSDSPPWTGQFVDCADGSRSEDERSNALQAACWAGQLGTARLLLRYGADPNRARQHNGATCLCIAAHAGHTPIVRLLVAAGAELNHNYNENGATPVFIAAEHGREAALRSLLLLGADPNAPDSNGCSPTYIAASRGHAGCIEILAAHGADVSCGPRVVWADADASAQDAAAAGAATRQVAPIHIAIWRGRMNCFERLLDCGARADALAPAAGGGTLTVAQLIWEKYGTHANTREELLLRLEMAEGGGRLAAARQRLAWAQLLVSRGAAGAAAAAAPPAGGAAAAGAAAGAARLTADLRRHIGERVPSRARFQVAVRATEQARLSQIAGAQGQGQRQREEEGAGQAAAAAPAAKRRREL